MLTMTDKTTPEETQTQRVKHVRTPEEQAVWDAAKRKIKIIRMVGKMNEDEKDEWLTAIYKSRDTKTVVATVSTEEQPTETAQ